MNIFDVAATDHKAITGDALTSLPITLTEADATEHEIHGHAYRTEEQLDPETGVRMYEPGVFVSYHVGDYPEVDETWTATVTIGGVEITGSVINPRRNYTTGQIVFQVETA